MRWTAAHVARIQASSAFAPVLADVDIVRASQQVDFWDSWPVQEIDGSPAVLPSGDTLWMALGASRFDDPDERHGHARIHLLSHDGRFWHHHGPAMPDGFSPGSREWSGSAVLAPDRSHLVLYFTATGRRGETELRFEQRIFAASAAIEHETGSYRLAGWRDLREVVVRDGRYYMDSKAGDAGVGTIKAFRDPAFFRDPATGRDYLFFAGSAAGSRSAFNGVVGAAVAAPGDAATWQVLPPLISADGLNNELERPHVVMHGGLYYLLWSTQRHVFDPAGPTGPTGLYGMVAESLEGSWRPMNGSGLVFANPPQAPRQAYSWLVLPDLRVMSFIDDWGRGADSAEKPRFAGTFAPLLQLWLDGERGGLRG
ncbi:MAG: glycoside hydrolase 68 family protein [Sphingomonadales bacterium 32-68-7]|nr:MAG: glycoside hydrolase 68 family protein [Sphingomonadales bacterium 12-68-11]OYX08725.1 MAG: glycoside hydrolase 68 family protein [Sphingomonadales bacterium 32-68-7]